jgi:hypothetical protein
MLLERLPLAVDGSRRRAILPPPAPPALASMRQMTWKIAFTLSLLGSQGGGCSTDECSQADDLVAACAPPTAPTPAAQQSMTLACGGARLCHARCINKSSCLAIEALQCVSPVACPPVSCNSDAQTLATCLAMCSARDGGPAVPQDAGSGGPCSDAGL